MHIYRYFHLIGMPSLYFDTQFSSPFFSLQLLLIALLGACRSRRAQEYVTSTFTYNRNWTRPRSGEGVAGGWTEGAGWESLKAGRVGKVEGSGSMRVDRGLGRVSSGKEQSQN